MLLRSFFQYFVFSFHISYLFSLSTSVLMFPDIVIDSPILYQFGLIGHFGLLKTFNITFHFIFSSLSLSLSWHIVRYNSAVHSDMVIGIRTEASVSITGDLLAHKRWMQEQS